MGQHDFGKNLAGVEKSTVNGIPITIYTNEQGLFHREDGPAVQVGESEMWFLNGKAHRVGGPAISWPSGSQSWIQDDLLHREDGPAVINMARGKIEYHVQGRQLTEEEFMSRGKP